MNTTKRELFNAVALKLDLAQPEVLKIGEGILDEIFNLLKNHGRLEIRGFGTFETKLRKPRKARNPFTGESVHISAKIVPKWKPSKELIEACNGNKKL